MSNNLKSNTQIQVLNSEKTLLFKMMMGKNVNLKNLKFIDPRHEWIAKNIYWYRVLHLPCGLSTDGFVYYLRAGLQLELCGGTSYLESILGDFADDSGVVFGGTYE